MCLLHRVPCVDSLSFPLVLHENVININFPFQSSCQQSEISPPTCTLLPFASPHPFRNRISLLPELLSPSLTLSLSLSLSAAHTTELLNYFVDIKHIKIQIDDTQPQQQQQQHEVEAKKGTTTSSYNGHPAPSPAHAFSSASLCDTAICLQIVRTFFACLPEARTDGGASLSQIKCDIVICHRCPSMR